MGKPKVLVTIDTLTETEDKNFGRKFMEILMNQDQRLVPELVSWEERFKDSFVDIDHFVANWWAMPVTVKTEGEPEWHRFWGPMWKRKSSLASRGMIIHGLIDIKYQRTPSDIWFQSRWAKDVDWIHLFEEWVALSMPESGMLHVFTEVELDFLCDQEKGLAFEAGTFGSPAKPGIPNIGWAMAYGESHAAEVDVARIEQAGFPVREVGGAIIVQVTEKLSDVVDNFAYFSKRRAELKQLFRPDLFLIKDEPNFDAGNVDATIH